jgi:hypothetical protein
LPLPAGVFSGVGAGTVFFPFLRAGVEAASGMGTLLEAEIVSGSAAGVVAEGRRRAGEA